MQLPLVSIDDKILRTVQPRFNFSNPATDPIQLAKTLAESMITNQTVALSAPQIGLPYRAFCIASNPIICCFNPVIADKSTEQVLLEEGDCNFPSLLLKVKRSKIIKIRYAEPNGNFVTKKFVGITARIMLQMVDHLDGKLFFDYCSRAQKDIAIAKANKLGVKYQIKDLLNNQGEPNGEIRIN